MISKEAMNKEDKEFVDNFEKNVDETIKKFDLIDKKEKVLVAASGGKDSTAVMYALRNLGYDIIALTIDVEIGSFTKKNLENLKEFCKSEGIELYCVSVREEMGKSICYMRDSLNSKGQKVTSCAVCGVVRRYLINKAARKLGVSKIVTGHNNDDEAQAFMMNLFRNTLQMSARLGPKSGMVSDSKFIPRVKPLYLTSEKDVVRYSKIMKFPVIYGSCPCSMEVFRKFVGRELNKIEEKNPEVKANIVDHFMSIMPELREKFKGGEIKHCKECGEPSKSETCRTCQMLEILNKD